MKKRKTYDAILLLGLKLKKNGQPTEELKGRSHVAAQCVRDGLAPVVIACGGQTENTPLSEATVMARLMENDGVPADKIILEDKSQVTYENIRNARTLLEKREPQSPSGGKPHVLVVTSDYHLFRAKHIARSMGMKASGCAYETPDNREKKIRRKKERYYFVNYVLGWETGKHRRPKWYDAAVKRIK